MRRRVLLAAAILMLAAAWLPAQKDRGKRDKGKDKPPDLEIIELKFRRDHTRFYNLETRRPEPGTE